MRNLQGTRADMDGYIDRSQSADELDRPAGATDGGARRLDRDVRQGRGV